MTFFNDAYLGKPGWDTGRPQPAFVALEDAGAIKGTVLDVGCGSGENALFLASRGHEVHGIDFAPRAIEFAQAKSSERGIAARFDVEDVLNLSSLGRSYDSVIDSGCFHTLSDEDRPRYVESVRSVLRPNGTLFILCFSDQATPGDSPRRVSKAEIEASFGEGWRIDSIEDTEFDTTLGTSFRAYLSSIVRTG